MNLRNALIIADPWIGYILDGSKTWEMRSRSTTRRGWIGLIRKGTGAVHGIARLVDVGRPLTPAEMLANYDKHRIPAELVQSGAVRKWHTPWVLADVQPLRAPVAYQHRSGAVTWAKLAPEVSQAIQAQLLGSRAELTKTGVAAAWPAAGRAKSPTINPTKASLERQTTPAAAKVIGEVPLTAGNIANNHIYLRAFFDRFPLDAVGGSNRQERAEREITIDWGGSYPARTDLDGTKRIFRARGWIRAFFEDSGAEPGDLAIVEEMAPYSYRLRLEKE